MTAITSAVLTGANAAPALLGIMLLSSFAALVAALYVRSKDQADGYTGPGATN
ncbi:MAG: hypothetical protein U5R46_18460 [Gammaproteobacteria bacterium]|nr:hypothetical protein [Gammaproteobacteria bacterium]